MEEKKLMLFNSSGPNKTKYKNIGYWYLDGKTRRNKSLIKLGNIDKLEQQNPHYVEIVEAIIKNYTSNSNMESLKLEVMDAIERGQIQNFISKAGSELVSDFIENEKIFDVVNVGKHKGMKEIFEYQITNRITNPTSILNAYNNKDSEFSELDYCKNSFYRLLDVLDKNKDNLLKKLKEINSKISPDNNIIHFDNTTLYFESFNRDDLLTNGYSKDGKFAEDQIVLAMACDSNGVPLHYKIFPGNTADTNTLIPFIEEFVQLFGVKKITVVADRGMSSIKNTNFLEELGIDFLISYRAKKSNKETRDFILDPYGFKELSDDVKVKEKIIYKINEITGEVKERKLIVTHSKSRARVEQAKRRETLAELEKLRDEKGIITKERIKDQEYKKYLNQIQKSKFTLDSMKIEDEEKWDGFYVYETSIKNQSVEKMISIYSDQWKIETNFRLLKHNLSIRPMYVFKREHIEGHVLLCFISLFCFSHILYRLNSFYFENGVIEKITPEKLINAIGSLYYSIEINSITKEILSKKRTTFENNNSWHLYDDILKSNKKFK